MKSKEWYNSRTYTIIKWPKYWERQWGGWPDAVADGAESDIHSARGAPSRLPQIMLCGIRNMPGLVWHAVLIQSVVDRDGR